MYSLISDESDDESQVICEYCNKKFLNKDKLIDHIKTHLPTSTVYFCSMCNIRFNSKTLLRRHLSAKHKTKTGPGKKKLDLMRKKYVFNSILYYIL